MALLFVIIFLFFRDMETIYVALPERNCFNFILLLKC